jgi:hypothetical protein
MDRRKFLKQSTFILASASLASPLLNAKKLIAGDIKSESFSFDIITDDADKAAVLGEQLVKEAYPHAKKIIVSEYQLAGIHTGDIVYMKDNRLVNYKSGISDISADLRQISKELDLPRKLNNPSCIRFGTEKNGTSDSYYVFHKNVLVKKIDASISRNSYSIQGTRGNVVIETKDNKARVVDSSCTHKTCMSMKSIGRSSEYIVCIPNEIQIVAA